MNDVDDDVTANTDVTAPEKRRDPLILGRISGVYGVKGWVRIQSYTEPRENLLSYDNCMLDRGGHWQSLQLDEGRIQGKGLVAHIRDVDDRSTAETLQGCDIAVAVEALPPLAEDEYYWHQLEGMAVMCGGELLGRVDHLLATGANDVLVVKPCAGSLDKRERLIPWLRGSVVTRVDLAEASIEVEWDPEF